MHLGDSNYAGDLALGEVLEEAEMQDRLLSLWESLDCVVELCSIDGSRRGVLGRGDRLQGPRVLFCVRLLSEESVLGHRSRYRLFDFCAISIEPSRQLVQGRLVTDPLTDLGDRSFGLQVQLLQSPGHPDRPSRASQPFLQLAPDRRGSEAGELDPPPRIESADGLVEGDQGDLFDVVPSDGTTPETPGQGHGEAPIPRDQLLDSPAIPRSRGIEQSQVLGFVHGHRRLQEQPDQPIIDLPTGSQPVEDPHRQRVSLEDIFDTNSTLFHPDARVDPPEIELNQIAFNSTRPCHERADEDLEVVALPGRKVPHRTIDRLTGNPRRVDRRLQLDVNRHDPGSDVIHRKAPSTPQRRTRHPIQPTGSGAGRCRSARSRPSSPHQNSGRPAPADPPHR